MSNPAYEYQVQTLSRRLRRLQAATAAWIRRSRGDILEAKKAAPGWWSDLQDRWPEEQMRHWSDTS